MRIKQAHIPYIANKIVLDMVNSSFVELKDNSDNLLSKSKEILEHDLFKERSLDERVKELLEEQEDEMEFMQVDRKNMFWLVKKKLAPDFDVILNNEDRHNDLAHKILSAFVDNDFINFDVSENRIKNLIFSSIENYLRTYESLEDEVYEKISHYKRKLVPGSEEFEIVFDKLYQEELKKRGML
ncbi:DUF507 family protein [Campylobacter avium]|uniref:DUF507 family protein n=1 Tax=Campylobacter avium TaxID=522485 RepID=UPI00255BDC93|nr:DUF507 family protein [Campylobacter avium]